MMSDSSDLGAELALALRLADAADAVTIPRFRAADLVVETKPDRTPVTDADRATEQAMTAILAGERPDHGILGEEYGSSGGGPWQWVLDPIDGTRNYMRGIPVWATLSGLVHNGRPVVGVVSAPSLHRRWWAAAGLGAFGDGDRLEVSAISRIEDAQVSFNELADFENRGWIEGISTLAQQAWRVRGFGDFWQHMLVAEGAVDVAVEASVNPWDMAAVQVIVEEAGGRFSDLEGHPDFAGGSALSTNGTLHDETLSLFAHPRRPASKTAK